jgi:DNA-binding HxlR family transcriptional regulator
VKRVSFADMNCTLARSLEVVGEWWTLLILRDCFLGVRRFDDFRRRLGISRNVLSERLDKLVADGILERRPYQDNPVRCEYRLTDKGRDLWPVIVTLRQWGDRWLAGDGQEPAVMIHEPCGQATTAVLHCEACGEPIGPRQVRIEPGPGLTDPELLATRR